MYETEDKLREQIEVLQNAIEFAIGKLGQYGTNDWTILTVVRELSKALDFDISQGDQE